MSTGPASRCGTPYATAHTWPIDIAPVSTGNGGCAGAVERGDRPHDHPNKLAHRPESAPCRSGSRRRNPALWITWFHQAEEALGSIRADRQQPYVIDHDQPRAEDRLHLSGYRIVGAMATDQHAEFHQAE